MHWTYHNCSSRGMILVVAMYEVAVDGIHNNKSTTIAGLSACGKNAPKLTCARLSTER